jgi:hypothetical protein
MARLALQFARYPTENKKLSAALHMYNLALEANPRLEETPSRIHNLNLASVSLPEKRMNPREELASMRTIILPTITKTDASADFDVLLAANKIEKANFVRGSDALRGAGMNPEKALFEEKFRPPLCWLQFRVLSALGGCEHKLTLSTKKKTAPVRSLRGIRADSPRHAEQQVLLSTGWAYVHRESPSRIVI